LFYSMIAAICLTPQVEPPEQVQTVELIGVREDENLHIQVQGIYGLPGGNVEVVYLKRQNTDGSWTELVVFPTVSVDSSGNFEIDLGTLYPGQYEIKVRVGTAVTINTFIVVVI
jgi:hypothetical protein